MACWWWLMQVNDCVAYFYIGLILQRNYSIFVNYLYLIYWALKFFCKMSEDLKKSNLDKFFQLSNVLTVICIGLIAKFGYDGCVLRSDLSMEKLKLNNTRLAKRHVLFFNRVPKVGSQTLMDLLKQLQTRNNFTHYVDNEDIKAKQGEKTILTEVDLKNYADMFAKNFTPPSSYSKHTSYIDFPSIGEEYDQPIYINFVREPVNRLVSWYYYIRAPGYMFTYDKNNASRYAGFKSGFNSPSSYKSTFEECVDDQNSECTYISGHNHINEGEGGSHASQIMFFCGHSSHCWVIDGEEAFQDAKRNVEQHYAVVGILEEIEKSLLVMEHYIPRFFDGVSEIYANRNIWQKEVNKNIFKPKTSEHVKNMIRQNLSREVEFYDFCKQRLHKQYLALNL